MAFQIRFHTFSRKTPEKRCSAGHDHCMHCSLFVLSSGLGRGDFLQLRDRQESATGVCRRKDKAASPVRTGGFPVRTVNDLQRQRTLANVYNGAPPSFVAHNVRP